jgi:hypothetical protein
VHSGVPGFVGLHTPFSHVKPLLHGAVSQLARHSPSAQTFPASHSLENLHAFCCDVHDPPTQAWPLEQSVAAVQGHGPAVPPHAWQLPETHALPSPQSVFVVHSFFAPGSVEGAEQTPALHTSPFGQEPSSEHTVAHPVCVQTWPCPQLDVPVHGLCDGAAIFVQP